MGRPLTPHVGPMGSHGVPSGAHGGAHGLSYAIYHIQSNFSIAADLVPNQHVPRSLSFYKETGRGMPRTISLYEKWTWHAENPMRVHEENGRDMPQTVIFARGRLARLFIQFLGCRLTHEKHFKKDTRHAENLFPYEK